jgi:MFS family permease
MSQAAVARSAGQSVRSQAWWKGLTKQHRLIAIATFLGWTLDGYETYALIATVKVIVADLAPNAGNPSFLAGLAIGLTLLGWGIGGLIGGVLADRFGRRPVMIWSIVIYALFTGLTALSPSYEVLIALRFMTGLALGSEWCTGASMIQEQWPERARTKGACFVQSGFGVGSLLAALVWLLVGFADPGEWRWVFVMGAIPGLLVVWLRRKLPESERWERATESLRQEGGTSKTPARRLLEDLDARRTILTLLVVSLATVVGWYAVASFLPTAAEELAHAKGMENPGRFVSWTLILYTIGSVCGYWAAAFIADRFGRRRLIGLFLLGSFILTVVVYLWTGPAWAFMALVVVNGAFTLGGFAWIPIYVPELFGSAVRATASGVVFNATRLIAWVGPILTGTLIAAFGGVKVAAITMGLIYLLALAVVPLLRETRGDPLPD